MTYIQFSELRLDGVGHRYGEQDALIGLDLTIRRGEFIAMLGPSGCGKTTALKCIAGLLPLTTGAIWMDDRRLELLPPQERGFGMVFQNYALFPHMTVRKNIEFGLRMRRLPRSEIKRRAAEAIRLVQLEDYANSLPGHLSGGQQQRVAIARAVVREPTVVLMDEPLSNLDSKLRLEMRTEIRRLHQARGLTTVYVTHDQEEALSMADRVVMLKDGRVQQIGTPQSLHMRPVNWQVAAFMGYRNLFSARVVRATHNEVVADIDGGPRMMGVPTQPVREGDRVVVAVRPEDLLIVDPATDPDAAHAAGTGWNGYVSGLAEVVEFHGREAAVQVRADEGLRLQLRTGHRINPGDSIHLRPAPNRLLVFPSGGQLPPSPIALGDDPVIGIAVPQPDQPLGRRHWRSGDEPATGEAITAGTEVVPRRRSRLRGGGAPVPAQSQARDHGDDASRHDPARPGAAPR